MKTDKSKLKYLLPVFCLASAVVISAGLRAKYVTSIKVKGSVTFSQGADIADSMTLLESPAVQNTDGSYTLNTSADKVTENTYTVMPGVDIPKDPKITIENKTSVPSYLYIEVIKSADFPSTVKYSLTSDWSLLSGVTGKEGGDVYVYQGSAFSSPIGILAGDKIIVSDQYAGDAFSLNFHGYLLQKTGSDTAAQTFTFS